MIRELKPARWVATEGEGENKQDKYVIEVAVDSETELEKMKDNSTWFYSNNSKFRWAKDIYVR